MGKKRTCSESAANARRMSLIMRVRGVPGDTFFLLARGAKR